MASGMAVAHDDDGRTQRGIIQTISVSSSSSSSTLMNQTILEGMDCEWGWITIAQYEWRVMTAGRWWRVTMMEGGWSVVHGRRSVPRTGMQIAIAPRSRHAALIAASPVTVRASCLPCGSCGQRRSCGRVIEIECYGGCGKK